MKLYCIGDLHLSGETMTKPMDVFGPQWKNHPQKIKENWLKTVTPEDVVILCGDTSWAMGLNNAKEDLEWVENLPGQKILLRGNHDYWWTSVSKMRTAYPNLQFLQNDSVMFGTLAVCGSRGWKVPSNENFTEEDNKIYQRELIRLDMSMTEAMKKGATEIIVVLHFPPFFHADEENGFMDLFRKYPVKQVLFGHIHGENNIAVFEGEREGIKFKLCSCDTQGFKPTFVREMESNNEG